MECKECLCYTCKNNYDIEMISMGGSKKGKCKEGCYNCNGNEKALQIGKCDEYVKGN